MGRTVVYVHGGGQQDRDELHAALDTALGDRYRGMSRLAFYADICWGEGRNLVDLVEAIAASGEPPDILAERLVTGLPSDVASLAPHDLRDLIELAAQLLARAADHANRTAAGSLIRDLKAYLWDRDRRTANRMRARVRETLGEAGPDAVVVAHSLGTILAYDILAADGPGTIGQLITVGSPMGFGRIQDRLRDYAGRPNPVPGDLTWTNAYDRRDVKVGLSPRLSKAFPDGNLIVDLDPVDNKAPFNHDFGGYLRVRPVSEAIDAAAGRR